MTEQEKRHINKLLSEVAEKFSLKIKLTVNNAHQLIEENYRKVREIEESINLKLMSIKKAA